MPLKSHLARAVGFCWCVIPFPSPLTFQVWPSQSLARAVSSRNWIQALPAPGTARGHVYLGQPGREGCGKEAPVPLQAAALGLCGKMLEQGPGPSKVTELHWSASSGPAGRAGQPAAQAVAAFPYKNNGVKDSACPELCLRPRPSRSPRGEVALRTFLGGVIASAAVTGIIAHQCHL